MENKKNKTTFTLTTLKVVKSKSDLSFFIFEILSTFLASFSKKANFKRRFRNHGKILSQIFRSSTECSGHGIVILLIFGGSFFMEKY